MFMERISIRHPLDSTATCLINHLEESMSDQQANALRVVAHTFEDLADVLEADLPALDQSDYEEVIQDVSATDTAFAERWDAIKACVDAHFERLSLDESLDRTTHDYVAISGGHPPEHRALTLSVRYYPEGRVKVEVGIHDETEASSR